VEIKVDFRKTVLKMVAEWYWFRNLWWLWYC